MIMQAAALIATGTAGFLVGDVAGAATGVLACTVVLIAWWLRTLNAEALSGPAEQPWPSTDADFDDVIERLDALARERNWDLGKHFAIAHMARQNRTMTFDELERRYDRGLRSPPDTTRQIRQDSPEGPKNDVSL